MEVSAVNSVEIIILSPEVITEVAPDPSRVLSWIIPEESIALKISPDPDPILSTPLIDESPPTTEASITIVSPSTYTFTPPVPLIVLNLAIPNAVSL